MNTIMIPYEHFSSEQLFPLLLAGIIMFLSITTFKRYTRVSLLLLFVGAIGLGYFTANLDHFLNLWDEQYHALVSKNLSNDFLTPTLFTNSPLPLNYKVWTNNHIWLHKQPLFLWQMAICIKLFGTTELAVRLPSIIMHALIPLMIYRIGEITINKKTGYYGALFFCFAHFPLELIVGKYTTDHNDVAFLFYVTGSFWAWFEYTRTQNKYWLIAIGFFSGCAVLVKWLMGLIVFVIWTFTTFVSNSENRFKLKSYLPIFISGIISLIIFLPWQIYTHVKFPIESTYEMKRNAKHFFKPIENHSESTWYYFTSGLKTMYGSGDLIPYTLLLGIILLIVNLKKKEHKIFIAFAITFVYVFYTIAQTKMPAFTIIVSPLIYLGLGFLTYKTFSLIYRRLKNSILQQIISVAILSTISFISLNLTKIQTYHTHWNQYQNHNRLADEIEMNFIKNLNHQLKNERYVIFNTTISHNGNIPIMFYTDHIGYNYIPNQDQINTILNKNMKIAVLNIGDLPEYITQNKNIKLLKVKDIHLLNK